MKTPEEIRKGLEACVAGECHSQRHECPYRKEAECTSELAKNALAYIRQLEEQVVELSKTLEHVKRERDAAVTDLKEADRLECNHCRWFGLCQADEGEDFDCNTCTIECKCGICRDNNCWEWRGPKEDE